MRKVTPSACVSSVTFDLCYECVRHFVLCCVCLRFHITALYSRDDALLSSCSLLSSTEACTGFGPTLLPVNNMFYLAAASFGLCLTTLWNIARRQ